MSATKDFFVSYNRADKQWAEWIAWTLEEAGYSVVIQAWDFRPGGNFVLDMQRAATESHRTIAVLSETYLKSAFTAPEWAAAFASDPQSLGRKLLPVRVKECQPTGLLGPIVYVDLVGVPTPEVAQQRLLAALAERAKPLHPPAFPGTHDAASVPSEARLFSTPQRFPTALSQVQAVKAKSLQTRLDHLMADLEALDRQFGFTNDAVERTRLDRQRVAILQDMEKVADDLNALGA
jgi:hypothetical protein